LATFASGRSGLDPAESILTAPMSFYAESFRKLRAVIDLGLMNTDKTTSPLKKGKVILVSSAIPAEGKTTTAIALARTYALSGVSTLLIDADLRRHAVAARLGNQSTTGLIDFLAPQAKEASLPIATFDDTQSQLTVISAGQRSNAPTDQLLNGPSFQGLMDSAIAGFDIVIIDSPPLLPVVDTRYLARFADAVVHVVRYGSTTQGELREAATQLREFLRKDAIYLGLLNMEERGGRQSGYYGEYGQYGAVDD
jgi:polysaccharide biosynthesis transport protein